MVRRYVRTIEDMERMYYGAGVGQDYAFSGGELLKADAPLLSTTGGTYNAIYGRKVWSQLNQEFNAFSIMPKGSPVSIPDSKYCVGFAVWNHM